MSVLLTDSAIDSSQQCQPEQFVQQARGDESSGAQLWFLGVSRRHTQVGSQTLETQTLDYDAYRPMAEPMLGDLCKEAGAKFGLNWIRVVHRLGCVPPGETSLLVGIGSAHRRAAIEALDWFVDRLKKDIPIWKRETWSEGGTQWVHPADHEADDSTLQAAGDSLRATAKMPSREAISPEAISPEASDSIPHRVYLDHAATGWPKSKPVLDAMGNYLQNIGASASRGTYRQATEADEMIRRLRQKLAKQINCPSADCVSLQSGATAALNTAIFGFLRQTTGVHGQPPAKVVTTAFEHNAVLRPLEHLRREGIIQLKVVEPNSAEVSVKTSAMISADQILDAVDQDTVMVAMTSASNVTGVALPVAEVAKELQRRDTIVLCDAAQTFGWLPIDVSVGIDVLVAPAHKAAGGPPGIAMLSIADHLHSVIQPYYFGGTGHDGMSSDMPTEMPQRLEPGTHNMPAVAAWLAAIESEDQNPTPNKDKAGELAGQLHHTIRSAGAKTIKQAGDVPVTPFWIDGYDAQTVAAILDAEFGIQVRAGKHCAARIHGCLDFPEDGVVRASAGPTTSMHDIEALGAAIKEIVGA